MGPNQILLPMAQSKTKKQTVLFWGRLDKDTGFLDCVNLCQTKGYNLEIAGDGPLVSHIPAWARYHRVVSDPQKIMSQVDFVYTTGYLGLLDVYIAKKPVLYSYTNPVKKDYLQFHPMHKKPTSLCYRWAKDQTWKRLAELYLKLWQK
jgi:hypothetical protein